MAEEKKIKFDLRMIGDTIEGAVKDGVKGGLVATKGELDNVDWGSLLQNILGHLIPKVPLWIDSIFGSIFGKDIPQEYAAKREQAKDAAASQIRKELMGIVGQRLIANIGTVTNPEYLEGLKNSLVKDLSATSADQVDVIQKGFELAVMNVASRARIKAEFTVEFNGGDDE